MVLPIYVYGSPVLRKKAEEVKKDHPNLKKLVADMFDTMYKSDGLGLAAPQVGQSLRLFVVDGAPLVEDDPTLADFKKVFINPEITSTEGDLVKYSEGCLSIPSIREEVTRASVIKIKYYDEKFDLHEEIYDGVRARVIQHEYDHLEGILMTDRLNPIKRRLLNSKLTSISKGKVETDYKIKALK